MLSDDLLLKTAEDLGHALGRLLRASGKDWPADTRPIIGRFISAARQTAKERQDGRKASA